MKFIGEQYEIKQEWHHKSHKKYRR